MYPEVVGTLLKLHEISIFMRSTPMWSTLTRSTFHDLVKVDLLCAPLEVGGCVSGNVEVRIFLAESIETQECVFFK